MKHHVIYVPGLGDDILHVQSLLIQYWRLFGVSPHMHAMPWAGDEGFDPKLQRLIERIDALHARGRRVSLVGASAGASGVLHAYIKRKDTVSGLVYICGKINHPETVSQRTYNANPAFKESVGSLAGVLAALQRGDKPEMLSLYSRADTTVPYRDTVIQGVREVQLPPVRHGWAIIYALSLGAPKLLYFLKRVAKQM